MEKLRTFGEKSILILGILLFAVLFYNIHWKVVDEYRTTSGQSLKWTFFFLGVFLVIQLLLLRWTKTKKDHRILLVGLLVLAFTLRLIWILQIPTEQVSDFKRTWDVAGEIAGGNFRAFTKDQYLYVNPHWAFTALFYSLVYKIGNGSLFLMKMVNVFFGTISCYLAYGIASEIAGRKNPFALFLMALNFGAIAFVSALDPQNIATTFFYCSVLLYLKIFDNELSPYHFVTVGAMLGLGNLFRPVGIIFVLAILLHALIFGTVNTKIPKRLKTSGRLWQEDHKGAFIRKQMGLMLMIVTMILVPFVLNKTFQGIGILQKFGTDGGTWLLYVNAGMNHESNGMWNKEDYQILRDVNFDLDKANAIAKEKLKERLADKGKVISLLYRKYKIQWSNASFGGFYWAAHQLDHPTHEQLAFRQKIDDHIDIPQSFYGAVVLLILCQLGLQLRKTNRKILLPIIIWIGFVCLYTLIEMQPRYGYIALSPLMILGSLGWREENVFQEK